MTISSRELHSIKKPQYADGFLTPALYSKLIFQITPYGLVCFSFCWSSTKRWRRMGFKIKDPFRLFWYSIAHHFLLVAFAFASLRKLICFGVTISLNMSSKSKQIIKCLNLVFHIFIFHSPEICPMSYMLLLERPLWKTLIQ